MNTTLEKRKLLDFLKKEVKSTLEKLSSKELSENKKLLKKTEKIKKMISFLELSQKKGANHEMHQL